MGLQRLLIVEDDLTLGKGLAIALGQTNREIQQATTLKEAVHLLKHQSFYLGLLDINLPDGSGLDLLREIKLNYPQMAVILLSANDLELDVVTGLELGADDYVTKPFSLAILKARVDGQLRKLSDKGGAVFQMGPLSLDFNRMVFCDGDQRIDLTKTEQKLLKYLLDNPKQVLTREQLIDYVWDEDGQYVDVNALSVTIKRLRDKLGDANQIQTVYGIGYKWGLEHD